MTRFTILRADNAHADVADDNNFASFTDGVAILNPAKRIGDQTISAFVPDEMRRGERSLKD